MADQIMRRDSEEDMDSQKAFSLVELLVVISIVAFLVVLLFPAYRTFMERAQSVRCVGNLKQIGTGIGLYAAENDGHYPNSAAPLWFFAIEPYMGLESYAGKYDSPKVFRCPSAKPADSGIWGVTSYGINACVSRGQYDAAKLPYPRTVSLGKPSQRILVGDAFCQVDYVIWYSQMATILSYRHSGRANILWCDYSVSSVTNSPPRYMGRWDGMEDPQ